jgi:uncharacterized protein (TIGR02391 family)
VLGNTVNFLDYLHDTTVVEILEPEDLGGFILEWLSSNEANVHNISLTSFLSKTVTSQCEHLRIPLAEAWNWLEREGLIAVIPNPINTARLVYITRKGQRFPHRSDYQTYLNARLLPERLIHPILLEKIYSTFLRGDYDTAVFQSFKELEVAMRVGGGFAATDLGVDLARKAFRPATGSLTDSTSPLGEQEALMHLMAGAVGSYKNPNSHRHMAIDAEQAAEMIVLAGHLLRIIEKRVA